MYKVALVQNQSEMSHYGYADARPLIEKFDKYETFLYTAQNIFDLSKDLTLLELDAVIFASNALNDKTIRSEIFSLEFREIFSDFLYSGKGCIVLSQLRIGSDGRDNPEKGYLDFLPNRINGVKAIAKEKSILPEAGEFHKKYITDNHPCFLYPHDIDLISLKNTCLSFKSLKGLYWHHWDNIDESEWDILLFDQDENGIQKPLVVSSKEADNSRIVLCSLTIDWQKQEALLDNMLVYVIEGKHHTALLTDNSVESIAFNYLVASLKAQKYPFTAYEIHKNLADFTRNLKKGIHSIIVVESNSIIENMATEVRLLIEQFALAGKLKIIGIDKSNSNLKKFYVVGREKYALRVLYKTEMQIQKELKEGYIDGSFWSTIESLQNLDNIVESVGSYSKDNLQKVLSITNGHDRNGSYDGTFGATCAFLWIRARYLGENNKETQKTLRWLKENISDFDDREQALAYTTILDLQIETEQDKNQLKAILLSQDLEKLSEVDAIVYLRAAIKVELHDLIKQLILRLSEKQHNGYWIDLATSASACSILVDALNSLQQAGKLEKDSDVRNKVISMLFRTIIYIQRSMNGVNIDPKAEFYPWENKASTTLKCIHAWLKFEQLLDLPVYEVIDSLRSYSRVSANLSAGKTSLAILEEIKTENKNVKIQNKELKETIHKSRHLRITNQVSFIYFLLTVYFALSVFIFAMTNDKDTTKISLLLQYIFLENWIVHVTLFTLIFSIIGAGVFKRKKSNKSSEGI